MGYLIFIVLCFLTWGVWALVGKVSCLGHTLTAIKEILRQGLGGAISEQKLKELADKATSSAVKVEAAAEELNQIKEEK